PAFPESTRHIACCPRLQATNTNTNDSIPANAAPRPTWHPLHLPGSYPRLQNKLCPLSPPGTPPPTNRCQKTPTSSPHFSHQVRTDANRGIRNKSFHPPLPRT